MFAKITGWLESYYAFRYRDVFVSTSVQRNQKTAGGRADKALGSKSREGFWGKYE